MFDPKDVEELNQRFDAAICEKQNEEKQRGHKWSGGGGFQQWLDDLDNEEWDWPWGMGT